MLRTNQFALVPLGQIEGGSGMKDWIVPVAVLGAIGLFGFMIYSHAKLQQQIVKEHGVKGALAYQAGMTGLSVLGSHLRARSNRRRGKRRRK